VEVAPWPLALVMVMEYIEGLTDRQAADAVRHCMDWKDTLSLDLTDLAFDFTLLHDLRCRLLADEAGQRFLDALLAACKARGWVKARGRQRIDATPVLAAVRPPHRLACVLEAMHGALNELSAGAPAWRQHHVLSAWYTRYALRSEQARSPQDTSQRETLAARLGRTAFISWSGFRPQTPAQACGPFPSWRCCGRYGSNSMTAGPFQGGKCSAGARGTSRRSQRYASPFPLTSRRAPQ
jgi:Transposase domain (DUF772)